MNWGPEESSAAATTANRPRAVARVRAGGAATSVASHASSPTHAPATATAAPTAPPIGVQVNGRVVKAAVDPDTMARLAKANKRMEKILHEKLGSDFFGTISYEAIFANGQIVQINVTGTEKIR